MVIQIDNAGLSAIYAAGQQVSVLRSVTAFVETTAAARVGAANLSVAWLAFAPLASNTISWTDHYCWYASTSSADPGTCLSLNAVSANPAATGIYYVFANGSFAAGASVSDGYVASNASPGGPYLLGLAQAANINGASVLAPVCAAAVLRNEAVYVTPSDTISIFLSSASSGGTVIPPPGSVFSIAVSAGASGPTIGFDDQSNLFYQIS